MAFFGEETNIRQNGPIFRFSHAVKVLLLPDRIRLKQGGPRFFPFSFVLKVS